MNFNSIKVRLRPVEEIYVVGGNQFQFHKGSIKTGLLEDCLSQVIKFQFHKGSIKTMHS